ncbi:MAG: ATP-binding protein [Eubacteriales bacterium]|nr:sensor histidine kinase [Eubacteriales bacterium]MDD7573589.1 ATP-binding protein [Eubacteriales bacterium]
MKELSLNILDIAQNSVKANASLIGISIDETDDVLSFKITDNGKGMTADFLSRVTDPFTTTRTTRKVGLGLPFLKMEAEMTGGSFSIKSKSETEYKEHGTEVFASFNKKSIDYIPLGDIIGTLCALVQGAENTDFIFNHKMPHGEVFLSTKEMRELLGDVPLGSPEVISWVREYLSEAYSAACAVD